MSFAKHVYLAGPITGMLYGEARNSWRPYVAERLNEHIKAWSPLRVVNKLQPEVGLLDGPKYIGLQDYIINLEILERDENDIRNSDAMIANMLGATRVSIGTVAEIAMARILNKPIVLVMEEGGNLHEHPFVTAKVARRVTNLDDGIDYINHLLTPGV